MGGDVERAPVGQLEAGGDTPLGKPQRPARVRCGDACLQRQFETHRLPRRTLPPPTSTWPASAGERASILARHSAGRRDEPGGGVRDARPLHHRDHRRHRHQRAGRRRPRGRRSGGATGAARHVDSTRCHASSSSGDQRPASAGSLVTAQQVSGGLDLEPTNESSRAAVFEDADRQIVTRRRRQIRGSDGVNPSAPVRGGPRACHSSWHANGTATASVRRHGRPVVRRSPGRRARTSSRSGVDDRLSAVHPAGRSACRAKPDSPG